MEDKCDTVRRYSHSYIVMYTAMWLIFIKDDILYMLAVFFTLHLLYLKKLIKLMHYILYYVVDIVLHICNVREAFFKNPIKHCSESCSHPFVTLPNVKTSQNAAVGKDISGCIMSGAWPHVHSVGSWEQSIITGRMVEKLEALLKCIFNLGLQPKAIKWKADGIIKKK